MLTDPATLSFPRPVQVIVPKVERSDTSSNAYTSDSISEDHGISVKPELGTGIFHDEDGVSSRVLNEIRPVHQSDIPGYERDAVAEMQLASFGEFLQIILR